MYNMSDAPDRKTSERSSAVVIPPSVPSHATGRTSTPPECPRKLQAAAAISKQATAVATSWPRIHGLKLSTQPVSRPVKATSSDAAPISQNTALLKRENREALEGMGSPADGKRAS